MAKNIYVSIGVHVDAVAGWLGSYGGEDSPNDISRGVFAAEVGTPRILNLLDKYGIKGSFYIPGHTIESFPEIMKTVAESGHEIGLHGYSHENPRMMNKEQEEAVLTKCIGLIEKLSGKKPVGFNAPWWELSVNSVDLMNKYGIIYDNSFMYHDFKPYYLRVGDSWTPIDYSKPAEEWMKPFKYGEETNIVSIPASWYLDDLPPMMFIKANANSYGFENPESVMQMWQDQFDWIYREEDYAVMSICIHPDVTGHPHVLLHLEKLLDHIKHHPGVEFKTNEWIARDYIKRYPRG